MNEKEKNVLFIPRLAGTGVALTNFTQKIAQGLDGLAQGLPANLTIIAFDKKLDTVVTEELKNMATSNLNLISWSAPQEIMEIIPRFDLVISMRLHGLILALLHLRPAVAIGSLPKMERLAREWNIGHIRTEDVNPHALVEAARKALPANSGREPSLKQKLGLHAALARSLSGMIFDIL